MSRPIQTLGQRVRDARQELGLSQQALADLAGLKQPDISKIELGHMLSTTGMARLAAALKVSASWLETGEGDRHVIVVDGGHRLFGWLRDNIDNPTAMPVTGDPPKALAIDENPDYPAIRRVRFKLSAGASGFEVDYLSNGDSAPIVFRREWYESRGLKPEHLFAIRVAGASMEPGLFEGDTVVVNTADRTPKDAEVFAVNYEGELVIKRLVRDSGQWWLASDNPDQRRFPRKSCHETVALLGRVVHKQSEHI